VNRPRRHQEERMDPMLMTIGIDEDDVAIRI